MSNCVMLTVVCICIWILLVLNEVFLALEIIILCHFYDFRSMLVGSAVCVVVLTVNAALSRSTSLCSKLLRLCKCLMVLLLSDRSKIYTLSNRSLRSHHVLLERLMLLFLAKCRNVRHALSENVSCFIILTLRVLLVVVFLLELIILVADLFVDLLIVVHQLDFNWVMEALLLSKCLAILSSIKVTYSLSRIF
jgi:hypothetical protein